MHHPAHAPGSVSKDGPRLVIGGLDHLLRPLNCPGEHTYTITEQRTVDGKVDISGNHGAVDTERASAVDLAPAREVNDVVQQLVQGGWLDQVGLA